eukprot:SAG31_NODE_5200_length_2681_cov_4.109218_2_plen_168_part_00
MGATIEQTGKLLALKNEAMKTVPIESLEARVARNVDCGDCVSGVCEDVEILSHGGTCVEVRQRAAGRFLLSVGVAVALLAAAARLICALVWTVGSMDIVLVECVCQKGYSGALCEVHTCCSFGCREEGAPGRNQNCLACGACCCTCGDIDWCNRARTGRDDHCDRSC